MDIKNTPDSFAMFSPEGNVAVKGIVVTALARTNFMGQDPVKAYLSAGEDLTKLASVFPEATDTAVMECVYSAIVLDGKGINWNHDYT
tara:strand:- start:184 stop:447 length:264 start_codon:yes stop_codon:yes gene_type:complete